MEMALHEPFTSFARIGSSLIYYLLSIAGLLAILAAGFHVYKMTRKPWLAWASGLVLALAFSAFMWSTFEALHRAACHGAADAGSCIRAAADD